MGKTTLAPRLPKTAVLVALCLLVLFLAFAGPVIAYELRGGEIMLVRPENRYIDWLYAPPEYLSVEDLVFITCIEEDAPVISSVLCIDDTSFTDIETRRWDPGSDDDRNCFIGSFNLDERPCGNMIVQSEYVKDDDTITMQQKLKVNRLTSVLDIVGAAQYSDGGWKNSIETAGGLWVLSNYPDIFDDEVEMGIEWLKLNRNNDHKCWPNRDCNTRSTARILAYLTLSNFSEARRVVHDSIVFLEKSQNFYTEDDLWTVRVSPFDSDTGVECLINYNQTYLNNQTFTIEENSEVVYEITPYANKNLDIVCDHDIEAVLSNGEDEQVFLYEGDNMSYPLPWNCWSVDAKWKSCDLEATLFAMMSNISLESKIRAFDYLQSELRTDRSGEMYIGDDNNITQTISNTALYLYVRKTLMDQVEALDDDDGNYSRAVNATGLNETVGWLRYMQNNNGSWGREDVYGNIYPTGYSILGLMRAGFNRTHEVIRDAENWVVGSELSFLENITADYLAWNNTEMDALAFIVLKNNARPMLKTVPRVVVLDEESVVLEVFNPTTFDLEDVSINTSESLQGVIVVEEERFIDAYSYVKLRITRNQSDIGNIYGYISFFNFDDELARVPVMVIKFPKIEIKGSEAPVPVFGTTARVSFDVSKTPHTFKCRLAWEDDEISSRDEFTVSGSPLQVDVTFSEPLRVDETYYGEFACTADGNEFTLPVSLNAARYPTFPFTLSAESIFINQSGLDASFQVENNLDESLDITLGLDKQDRNFELSSTTLTLVPRGVANVTVFNNAPSDQNISAAFSIEVSSLEQKRSIRLRAEITQTPPKQWPAWLFYLLLGLGVAVIGAGSYLAYVYWDRISALLSKKPKGDDALLRIKKLEEKEKNTAIVNMVRILRMQRKDDAVIRKRLSDEGFSEAEIKRALSQEFEAEDKEGGASQDDDIFKRAEKEG